MITVVENELGYVIAYCQWDLVNPTGALDPKGQFAWIRDMWIHKSFRRSTVISDLALAMDCHPASSGVRYVYWEIVRFAGKKIHDDVPRENLVRKLSRAYHKDVIRRALTKRSSNHAIH